MLALKWNFEQDSDTSGFRCQVLGVPLCSLHTGVQAQMSCLRLASGTIIASPVEKCAGT